MENFIIIENLKFKDKPISKYDFIDIFVYSVMQRKKFIDGGYLCSLDYLYRILYSDNKMQYINKIKESLHRLYLNKYVLIDLVNIKSVAFIADSKFSRKFDKFTKVYYWEIDKIINLKDSNVNKPKLFYMLGFILSNIFPDKNYCELSYKYLNESLKYSYQTIQQYLNVLCDLKIIYIPKSVRFFNVNTKECNNTNLIVSRYADAEIADKQQKEKIDEAMDNDNRKVNDIDSRIVADKDFIALCDYIDKNIVKLNPYIKKKIIKLYDETFTYKEMLKMVKKDTEFICTAVNNEYGWNDDEEITLRHKQNIFITQLKFLINQKKEDNGCNTWGSPEPDILIKQQNNAVQANYINNDITWGNPEDFEDLFKGGEIIYE